MTNLIEKAKYFAIAAHGAINQTRKYTGESYYYHCESVANLVESVNGTDEMVAAAWLHDVVEDTAIEIGMIDAMFGQEVADYVWWVTDTEQGNRKERKKAALIRLGNAPTNAQTIKLADMIDNTSSIIKYDPNFAKVYMAEKRDLLEVLRSGDEELWNIAFCIVQDYFEGGVK